MSDSPGSGRDNREHERFDVDWRVTLKCPDWRFAGKVAASNASRGGLFLLTTRPPPIGSAVEITVALPDGTRVALHGTVQHVVTPERAVATGRSPGIGLKIDPRHDADLVLLEQMASAAASGVTGPGPAETSPLPRPEISTPAEPQAPAPTEHATAPHDSPVAAAGRAAPVARITPVARATTPAKAPAVKAHATPAPNAQAPAAKAPAVQAPAAKAPAVQAPAAKAPAVQAPAAKAPAAQAPAVQTPSTGATAATAPSPRPAADARPAWVRPAGDVARAVGIDFGTSYSSLSVAIGDTVVVVPDEAGRTQTPSIVTYPPKGPTLVGWQAREQLVKDPRRTVSSIKRLLGRAYGDPTIGGYLHSASFKTVQGPNDTILVDVDGNHYAVGQICAAIVARVRDVAEAQLGCKIRQAVLSMPASFTEVEKAALRRAAQLAGIEVIGLIEEPLAGALAYGFGQGKNEIVAVYDFGGGTFDFSVLDMSGDRFRVLAAEGDSWLGGDDFDLALAQAVADAFWRATKIELRQRIVEWQRLLLACEQAKRELSTATTAYITCDRLVEAPRRMDLRQRIDRPLFERLCHDLFERSLGLCRDTLARAGLEPGDVTQVVLTGGVSRIPFVREGLARFFEREIVAVVNPDEAICVGAGLRAARLVDHEVRGVAAPGR